MVRESIAQGSGHDARAPAILLSGGEHAQLRVRDAHFIRRKVKLASQAIEGHAIEHSLREIEEPRDARFRACSVPMQLAAQHAFHWIRQTKELLNCLHRGFIEIHIRGPLVLWEETPIGQAERSFDLCIHRAKPGVAARQSQLGWRITHVALEGIQREVVIANTLAADVAGKGGPSAGPGDLSVPLRAPGNFLDRVCRAASWPRESHR